MVINVREQIGKWSDSEDGQRLYDLISPRIKHGEIVEVSFSGVYSVSTSFVNGAFIQLLGHFDFPYITEHLTFRD